MKNILFLLLTSFVSAAFVYKISSPRMLNAYTDEQSASTSRYGKGCLPDLSSIQFSDTSTSIPLLSGWGNYRMPVTATNDSANIYFQQGINMYYGFHMIEAIASFERSVRHDSTFAMAHWGKALAYGPNINDVGYASSPEALEAMSKAKALYAGCTELEKALINAIQVRYSSDSTHSREHLNQLYAEEMKKVYVSFPSSADAAALYADALMVQHPWDLYDRFYKPKPWTPAIVDVLEKLVGKFPNHPGANHYYIHAIEGSTTPEKAILVADRLGNLMPGVSHLVHMPSHIYIRSGQYNKGIDANENAINGYLNYKKVYPLTEKSSFLYLAHNLHMQAACAAMDGQFSKSMKYAFDAQRSADSTWLDAGGYFSMYSQNMFMVPYLTMVRFGKWDDLIKAPAIPDSRVHAKAMMHFVKGMAYARKHDFTRAAQALERMSDSANSQQLQDHPPTFNPGIAVIRIGEKVLEATIAEEKGQLATSEKLYREAVDLEDGMMYNEPKDWLLPVRHYLGQGLNKQKKYKEAENVYKEDLRINPNNMWALGGLIKTLNGQARKTEASKVQQQLKSAKERSDVNPVGSVF
ncbi:MAG TPA: hypothetical protein VEZ55_13575 [Chitinophagaceae bacterium]|nr:hypothetical protein [Chitinophagaceae bacterium]